MSLESQLLQVTFFLDFKHWTVALVCHRVGREHCSNQEAKPVDYPEPFTAKLLVDMTTLQGESGS